MFFWWWNVSKTVIMDEKERWSQTRLDLSEIIVVNPRHHTTLGRTGFCSSYKEIVFTDFISGGLIRFLTQMSTIAFNSMMYLADLGFFSLYVYVCFRVAPPAHPQKLFV